MPTAERAGRAGEEDDEAALDGAAEDAKAAEESKPVVESTMTRAEARERSSQPTSATQNEKHTSQAKIARDKWKMRNQN